MTYVMWIMLVFLLLLIGKIIVGPSIWDRLMVMNIIATKIIIIIVIVASMNDRAYYLDFAIIYALFGFIGAIFIALFLSERSQRKKE